MLTEDIEARGFEGVDPIDPPDGALNRLEKALSKAVTEGRGKRTLADLVITFFTAVSGSPIGDQGRRTYAAIESTAGGDLISDYSTWRPQGPPGEPGVEMYDCYEVANEINALR